MTLEGRVALVTGGAQSIGAAIVRELVARGASVVVADVAVKAGERLARELGEATAFVPADISDATARELLVRTAAERFGGVDLLVNNAVQPADGGADATEETWLNAFHVNVVSAAMLIVACRPLMRARGDGVVVNIASVSGHRAQAGRWVYNACKAAVLQLTRSAARDLGEDGIRVVSVTPGWTRSRAIPTGGSAGGYHALGRIGEAEEVARAVAFLGSPDASFITGCDLPVDGGYLAMGPER